MSNHDSLSFSKDQQHALLGHAISDAAIFAQCRLAGVTKGWFFLDTCQRIWSDLDAFQGHFKRHPTSPSELQSYIRDEPAIETRLRLDIDRAVAARIIFPLDAIFKQLQEWAASIEVQKASKKIQESYNKGDIWPCKKLGIEMTTRLEQIEALTGGSNQVRPAPERAEVIKQEHPTSIVKLAYGVQFLDDITGGILPNDLIVIGAKTGAGKTEMVKQIALTNAMAMRRVTLFALEAEENEIERRVMYQMMVKDFFEDHKGLLPPGTISYPAWRHGELPQLDVYRAKAAAGVKRDLATLSTYYRTMGDFGISEMEDAITKAASTSDMVILDHLHYVDVEGGNENAELKAVIKKLRDLALVLKKPIIVVAHLRKTPGGKGHAVVPSVEDFHGSSDVIKIATTAILIGPVPNTKHRLPISFVHDKDARADVLRSWPTFMRLGKFRLEGARTRYTGIAFFDPNYNTYTNVYSLGSMHKYDTAWSMVDTKPGWAKWNQVSVGELEF